MWKQLVKMIWNQRRANGWIFAELLVVMGVLWYMVDASMIAWRTYHLPLGFDIENTFRLKLADLNQRAPGFVNSDERTTSEADDLLRLMDQIRMSNEVEEVCVTYFSCPYSNGDSWTGIEPVDGDTTGLSEQSFQVRRVTPEYFTVFRVKDKNGDPITPQLETARSSIVISADMEKKFFGTQPGSRRKVKRGGEEEVLVSAVSEPIRPNDYEISNPCFYDVFVGNDFTDLVNTFGASRAELCVRMKKDISPDEMNLFLASISDRLTVNNLYVYGSKKFALQREDKIRHFGDEIKIHMSLMAFMLINVFFGIIGTFWLRTQYRRGEIGLRVALGSSRRGLYRFMNSEGICLLLLTLPVIFFLIVNLAFMDVLETARIPFSIGRFLMVTAGSYLLMAGMICFAIWFPARKAANLPPAEALRHE